MRPFLRIDGDEFSLRGGRLVWYPALGLELSGGDDERSDRGTQGIAFNVVGHGSRNLVHVAGWARGEHVGDLSGAEVTMSEPGPDAALDGRLFGALLIRFGRVTTTRAVLSLDGDVEGIEAGSSARSVVAADLECAVVAAEIPAFCTHCGRSLAQEAEPSTRFVGGKLVRVHRPSPPCRACGDGHHANAPPAFCSACGSAYEPDGVSWQSDDLVLAYACRCPQGHEVSGALRLAA